MSPAAAFWTQTLANRVLEMPGPFQMLTPDLLLTLGIGAIGTALGLLVGAVMNARLASGNVELDARKRYLLALSLGGTAIGGVRYSPWLSDAYGYLSFALLLLLPVGVSALVVRELVRADV